MRCLVPVVGLALVVAACVAQQPPRREPLPDIEQAVQPARPCAFAVGPGLGVRINQVFEGTAADGTLEPDDQIVAIDRVEVRSATDLRTHLSDRRPGDTITLDILRDGQPHTVSLTLGSGPGDERRPFIGVTIVTVYDEVAPSAIPRGDGLDSPYARLISVEGQVYALDPVDAQVVAVGRSAPTPPWYGIDGRLYREDDGVIVDDEANPVPLPEGFEFGALLGAAADRLLVAGSRPDGSVVILAVEPGAGEVVWIHEPPPEAGIPIGTIANPGASRIVVGMSDPVSGTITFVILNTGDGRRTGEDARIFDGGRVLGWFDPTTLLGQDASGALLLTDVTTGLSTGASLPVAPAPGVAVWPVGDGTRVLLRDGGTLSVGGLTPGIENRPLVRRCHVEYVDEVGSGMPS